MGDFKIPFSEKDPSGRKSARTQLISKIPSNNWISLISMYHFQGYPDDTVVKNPTASSGDARGVG